MASHLINSGASIYEVKEILGHQDLKSTQVYARLATSSIARTSEIMSDKIEQVLHQDKTAQLP
jgi:site-specific recombinase XerD